MTQFKAQDFNFENFIIVSNEDGYLYFLKPILDKDKIKEYIINAQNMAEKDILGWNYILFDFILYPELYKIYLTDNNKWQKYINRYYYNEEIKEKVARKNLERLKYYGEKENYENGGDNSANLRYTDRKHKVGSSIKFSGKRLTIHQVKSRAYGRRLAELSKTFRATNVSERFKKSYKKYLEDKNSKPKLKI